MYCNNLTMQQHELFPEAMCVRYTFYQTEEHTTKSRSTKNYTKSNT